MMGSAFFIASPPNGSNGSANHEYWMPYGATFCFYGGISMKTLITCGLLIGAQVLFGGTAFGVRTIGEHLDANDPTTEGFGGSGAGASAVFSDMGFDAWNMTGPAGFSRYSFSLSPTDILDMQQTGFRMTANLRNTLAPDDAGDLGNIVEVSLASRGQWSLAIGADGSGDPELFAADLCCFGGTQIPLTGVSGAGYHEYQMVFNPNISATDVEVFVDGTSQGMMTQAASNFGDRFNWGNSDGGATHNTNWNLVRLETDLFAPVTPMVDPLVARHEGANDPNTEGFSGNGAGTSAVFADMGFDAWNQTDPASFARYGQNIPVDQAAEMASKGFRAKANVRNLRPDDDPGDLGAVFEVAVDGRQYTLFFGSAGGDPTVLAADNCCLGGTPITLDSSITGDGYHLFEMLFDPSVSATDVEILVDGISHGLMAPAASFFGERVTFGTSDSGATASVNWNLVEVTIIPEPTGFILIALSGLGMLLIRRER